MSTDKCKDFIEKLSISENLPLKTKWKRLKKYKENDLIYREFENNEGDEIIISEDNLGELNLVKLERNIELSDIVIKNQNKNFLLLELYKLTLDISAENKEFNKRYLEDISEESIREYILTGRTKYLENDIKKISIKSGEELNVGYEIMSLLSYHEGELPEKYMNNFCEDTKSERVGIIYDKENMYLHYYEKEGIAFFQAICGGDWEQPIQFLVYWSESEQRLKGFFPLGDANIYNQEYNCAYGSEYEKIDRDMFKSEEEYEKEMRKCENLLEKLDENYNENYKKALNNAFKELKKILNQEMKNPKPKK